MLCSLITSCRCSDAGPRHNHVDTQLCSEDSKFKNWHQGTDNVYTIRCSALAIMVANLGDILTIIFSYNLSSLFHQEMDCVLQDEDVTHNINKMTLGPYSFPYLCLLPGWNFTLVG